MEAIDYIKLFKLDQVNYEFKREEFILELGKDFLEYCKITQVGINSETGEMYYYRFKEIVKNFETKFWAISELKVGTPFSKNLWNAFFATQVVPLRKKLFPHIQAYIENQKDLREVNIRSTRDKNISDPKKGNRNGKGNHRPSRK